MSSRVKLGATSYKQAKFLTSENYITVFGGSAGAGKAQPLTSKVLTPDGWKLMGDIKVGDYVTTPTNGKARVVKVTPFDKKPIYTLTTRSGRQTECCDEHLWNVKLSKSKVKGESGVFTTQQISDHIKSGNKGYLPLSSELGSEKDTVLPVDPYLLGILISEGSLTARGVSFTTTDQEIVDRIALVVSKYNLTLKHSSRGSYRISHIDRQEQRNDKGQFIKSHPIISELRKLGLQGKNAYNKFIPEMYLNASINQRYELLRGLMDGDGTIDVKNICEYSTSSEQLSKDVQYLVRSLGGIARVVSRIPTYTYKGEKKSGALNHRVYIRFKDASKIFHLTRKRDRAKDRTLELMDEIISIDYVRDDKAQCISIDSDDHLYVTDDFLVTHNSQTGLIRFLKYVNDPEFVGYVFRKHGTDLRGSGALFDKAVKLFKQFDPKVTYTKQPMRINFPSGASIFFTGLDGQNGMDAIQGIEITAAMVDEATHLTEEEVWWIISRLRTNAKGIQPNIWLTCNPDIDSYLFDWVNWYLYEEGTVIDGQLVEGRPNPEKNCSVRWFITDTDGKMIWGDSKEYFYKEFPEIVNKDSELQPETFTFIGATCKDNPLMLKANPRYESNLLKLPRIKRERLYYGNWLAREEEAGYFKRDWVEVLDPRKPEDMVYLSRVTRRCRAWDIAGTLPSEVNPDPDYTAGVLIARTRDGDFFIEDVVQVRKRSGENLDYILSIAKEDRERFGNGVTTILPQDPAEAGKAIRIVRAKEFASRGIPVKFNHVGSKKSKLDKFTPFSSAAETGCIYVIKADWNEKYFKELEQFDGVSRRYHDDMVDASSESYNQLATTKERKPLNLSM